jgi:pantothenate kinase
MNVNEAIDQARRMAETGRRHVLGIVGAPGSGKSTLSAAIAAALGPKLCVLAPMDGFHLDNEVLIAHGTRDRKGAPFTFDSAGYASMVARLRTQQSGETIFAPRYDRAGSRSVACVIEIPADVPLVITEGNYLLLEDGPWAGVLPLLDACWYVDVPDSIRVPRLIARHVEAGKTAEAAAEWVTRSDEANAALVVASMHRATALVHVD